MTTYISILRGINVGGKNKIKMDALKKSYETIGFQYIRTYIQSGNVIFEFNDTLISTLEELISSQIKKDFGFDIPIIVLTKNKLQKIIELNPFSKQVGLDDSFMHVTFFATPIKTNDTEGFEAKKQIDEQFKITEDAIYLVCPNGYSNTKLSNNFIEKRLKTTATTRNWKTTNELLKIASN